MKKVDGGYRCPRCKRVLSIGDFGRSKGANRSEKRNEYCYRCGATESRQKRAKSLGDRCIDPIAVAARRKAQDLREAKSDDVFD